MASLDIKISIFGRERKSLGASRYCFFVLPSSCLCFGERQNQLHIFGIGGKLLACRRHAVIVGSEYSFRPRAEVTWSDGPLATAHEGSIPMREEKCDCKETYAA